MRDVSTEVTLPEVLLEFVRRLYAAEVQSAGKAWGAKGRLAERMGIHNQSLGQILSGAPDRSLTIRHLEQIRQSSGQRVSELLIDFLAVATALEHAEPATEIDAIKLSDAKGQSFVRRDAFPTGGAARGAKKAKARRPRRGD
jgi:hypothetical protein